jgi:hypothetical protein
MGLSFPKQECRGKAKRAKTCYAGEYGTTSWFELTIAARMHAGEPVFAVCNKKLV